MLPKNKLGASLFRNLRVYGDENHTQDSQKPKVVNIKDYL
jgi:large subunit ribosomal protein L13